MMYPDRSPIALMFLITSTVSLMFVLVLGLAEMDSSEKRSDQQIVMIHKNADFKVEGNPNVVEDLNRLKATEATEEQSKEILDRAIANKNAEIAAANLKVNTKTADAVEKDKADKLKALDDEYAKKRAAIEANE